MKQENSCILPEIFFKFYKVNDFLTFLSLFKEKGYEHAMQVCLMFNDDFTSPIFNQNNKEIGYAFKYNQNIKDYTPYIISYEYKTMIKLFFHYIKLHSLSIKNKTENSYHLINCKYMKKYKDYYEYLKLETYLSKDKVAYQSVIKINENYDYIVDDKIMTLIIKNLPKEYNQIFIDKSKNKIKINYMNEEPDLKAVENVDIFYYDDFELIDKELYSLLFKKNNPGNFCTCYFINEDICIKMPKDFSKTNSAIYLYGSLHSQHNFKAKYLLVFNTENDFLNNFNNQAVGFDKYINSFKFINTSTEQLTDMNNCPFGIIYNLNYRSISNNNNNNINNINNNNFNNNINISNQMPTFFNFSNFVPNPIQISVQAPTIIPINQPPLIGLENVGGTCYMNAILQCFSQIQEIVMNFQNNQQVNNTIVKYKNMNKYCLTESFKILIDNLWPGGHYNNNHLKNSNNYYYSPYDFKNKISSMNPLFNMTQTNEQMMLNYFINILNNGNKSITYM